MTSASPSVARNQGERGASATSDGALVAADLADIGVAKCHVGILGYQSGFLHGLDEIPCDVWSIGALERDREPAVCRQVGGKRNRGRADIGLGFDQIVESLYLDVPMREGAPAGVIAGRCVLPET